MPRSRSRGGHGKKNMIWLVKHPRPQARGKAGVGDFSKAKIRTMTELDLSLFLRFAKIEMRWDGDVLSTWISSYHLEAFTKLISSALSEVAIDAKLLEYGVIWIDLTTVCDRFGIDPERIYPRQNL